MKKPTGPGRPRFPKGMARSETLRVRLTKVEKSWIEQQSDNPSEWARQKLLEDMAENKSP